MISEPTVALKNNVDRISHVEGQFFLSSRYECEFSQVTEFFFSCYLPLTTRQLRGAVSALYRAHHFQVDTSLWNVCSAILHV